MKFRCSMPRSYEFVGIGCTRCVGSFFTSRAISDSISKDCIRTHKISTMIRECNSKWWRHFTVSSRWRHRREGVDSAFPFTNYPIGCERFDRPPNDSQWTRLTATASKLIDRLSSNYLEYFTSLLAFVQAIQVIIHQFATPHTLNFVHS